MCAHAVPLGAESQGAGIVRIAGRYRLPSDVVSELKHALADNPRVVLLDLHHVSSNSRLLHEVLDPVAGYLGAWPGTIVAICVPEPAMSAALAPATITDRLVLAGSPVEALERARRVLPRQHGTTTFLTPQPEAADNARAFTRQTLRGWQLQDMIWPASLVVSELVTHSILEAQTVLDLSLSRVDHRVRIAVHDYGQDHLRIRQPAEGTDPLEDPLRDRGLLVVRALTRCWGVFPSRVHGKTVWAVMESD